MAIKSVRFNKKKLITLVILIVIGIPILYSILKRINRPSDFVPDKYDTVSYPKPPGKVSELDALWRKCGRGYQAACDDLYEKTYDNHYSIYLNFAATCGERIEQIYPEVNCSQQLAFQQSPPTIEVIPWDGQRIGNLCLTSSETYLSIDDQFFTPIKDMFIEKLVCEPYYLVIVENGCDASMHVEISGEGHYDHFGDYSGATVTGTITLSMPGYPTLSQSVEGIKGIAKSKVVIQGFTQRPTPIEEAPYVRAIRDELNRVITDWFLP